MDHETAMLSPKSRGHRMFALVMTMAIAGMTAFVPRPVETGHAQSPRR